MQVPTADLIPCDPDFSPKNLRPEEKKMMKCAAKAIEEHHLAEVLKPLSLEINPEERFPMKLMLQSCGLQGKRDYMEDSIFYWKVKGGWLLGVCDGHTDRGRIGFYTAEECKERFAAELEKAQGNVKRCFQNLFKSIHEKFGGQKCGTIVVLCFINEENGIIYTATLGDSEAMIFRKFEDQYYPIPLSLVRNWSHQREAQRAAGFYQRSRNNELAEKILLEFPENPFPKRLRFPPDRSGLNISRAIGDKQYGAVISQNPLVTIRQLKLGDVLILFTDGLGDGLSEDLHCKQLLHKVIQPYAHDPSINLANKIAHFALTDYKSSDNTSVLVAFVEQMDKENSSQLAHSSEDLDSSDYELTESYSSPSPSPKKRSREEEKEEKDTFIWKKMKTDSEENQFPDTVS